MEPKEIEVVCPCCASRLSIDVRTQKLVRARRPEEKDPTGRPVVGEGDWTQALGRVREREDRGSSRLDDALDRERRRPGDLDDLFRKAREKLQDDEE